MSAPTVMLSPVSTGHGGCLASAHSVGRDWFAADERKAVVSRRRDSFSQYQSAFGPQLAIHAIPRSPITRERIARALLLAASPLSGAEDRATLARFDLVGSLPPEIGVKIFGYLHPQDLCRVCLVCRQWLWLAQGSRGLRRRKRKYLREKRKEYSQMKENFLGMSLVTPRQRSHQQQQGLARLMTASQSPLSVVQPTSASSSSSKGNNAAGSSSGRRSSGGSGSTRESKRRYSLPDSFSSSQRGFFSPPLRVAAAGFLQTPEQQQQQQQQQQEQELRQVASSDHAVERQLSVSLSESDYYCYYSSDNSIRRCLFPDSNNSSSNSPFGRLLKKRSSLESSCSASSASTSSALLHYGHSTFCQEQEVSVVGRRANRNRLKRLQMYS